MRACGRKLEQVQGEPTEGTAEFSKADSFGCARLLGALLFFCSTGGTTHITVFGAGLTVVFLKLLEEPLLLHPLGTTSISWLQEKNQLELPVTACGKRQLKQECTISQKCTDAQKGLKVAAPDW